MASKPNMTQATDYPIVLFADQAAFRAWLSAHHDSQPSLWLRIAKAASPLQSVTYAEALDVALCFGWIDGQKQRYDADSFSTRILRDVEGHQPLRDSLPDTDGGHTGDASPPDRGVRRDASAKRDADVVATHRSSTRADHTALERMDWGTSASS